MQGSHPMRKHIPGCEIACICALHQMQLSFEQPIVANEMIDAYTVQVRQSRSVSCCRFGRRDSSHSSEQAV